MTVGHARLLNVSIVRGKYFFVKFQQMDFEKLNVLWRAYFGLYRFQ